MRRHQRITETEENLARRPGSALRWRDRVRNVVVVVREQMVPVLSVMLLVALVVVPVVLFGWFLFFTDVFRVQAITVVDAREHTLLKAKELVAEETADLPFGRNIFFVHTETLEAAILGALPQVRTVHVTRKLPGTIKAVIQEKAPALLLLSVGTYYFVDEAGVAYEEARLETLPEVVLPVVKNDDRQAGVRLGVAAVDESFVTFVRELRDVLPDRVGAQIAETRIPSLAAREVHVVLDNNWVLLLDATRSAAGQAGVLQQLLTDTIDVEEAGGLEYIDLRIPNRVYYKVRNS